MGIPIGLIYAYYHYPCPWIKIILTCAGAYFIATNLFGYGEKTLILKYLPKWLKFTVSGLIFGLASFPILGWWSLLQAAVSGLAFYILFILDEKEILKNPWQELLRGFFGTLLMVVK
jgi:hypothetical protein